MKDALFLMVIFLSKFCNSRHSSMHRWLFALLYTCAFGNFPTIISFPKGLFYIVNSGRSAKSFIFFQYSLKWDFYLQVTLSTISKSIALTHCFGLMCCFLILTCFHFFLSEAGGKIIDIFFFSNQFAILDFLLWRRPLVKLSGICKFPYLF